MLFYTVKKYEYSLLTDIFGKMYKTAMFISHAKHTPNEIISAHNQSVKKFNQVLSMCIHSFYRNKSFLFLQFIPNYLS